VKTVFVDTHCWIATTNPHDQWHNRAAEVSLMLSPVRLVTTDGVLLEVLNFFGAQGSAMRNNAAPAARSILESAEVEMIFVGESGLIGGPTLYESGPDKEYSLTDCISMELMRSRDIQEVLTTTGTLPRRDLLPCFS
jgi:uncharacterized protein